MALTQAGASAIVGGAQVVSSFFLAKDVNKEAKKTGDAQRRLLDLQAKEQEIRNDALLASLHAQNQTLPFAVSNPGLPATAFDGGVRPAALSTSAGQGTGALAGGGTLLIPGIVGAILVGLLLVKSGPVA